MFEVELRFDTHQACICTKRIFISDCVGNTRARNIRDLVLGQETNSKPNSKSDSLTLLLSL